MLSNRIWYQLFLIKLKTGLYYGDNLTK